MASEVKNSKQVGLSDEEIEALEAEQNAGFSDEEIEALESGGDKYPAWRSALAGAEDTALLGYGPNIRGALKTQSFSSPEYIQERDRINAEKQEMREEDPGSFTAGQFAGGAASLAVPGAAVGKGAALFARLARAALAGAGAAAVADTPDVPGQVTEPTSPEDLKERAVNIATGAALGPVAELGVSAVRKITPDEVSRAFAALQPPKAFRREVRLAEEAGGLSTKDNIIKFARDEGMLDGLPNTKELYTRALAAKEKYGEALEIIYKRAQEAVDNAIHGGMAPNTRKFALSMNDLDSLKQKVIKEIRSKKWANTEKDSAIAQISNYFDGLHGEVNGVPDLLQLHEVKSEIGAKSFREGRAELPTSTEDFWRSAGRVIDDEIKSRIDNLAQVAAKSRDKNLGAALREANRRYSLSSDIYSMAADAVDSAAGRIPRDPGDLFGSALRSPQLQVGLSKVGKAAAAVPEMLKPSGAQVAVPLQQVISDATRVPTPREIYQQRVPSTQKAKFLDQHRKVQKSSIGQ